MVISLVGSHNNFFLIHRDLAKLWTGDYNMTSYSYPWYLSLLSRLGNKTSRKCGRKRWGTWRKFPQQTKLWWQWNTGTPGQWKTPPTRKVHITIKIAEGVRGEVGRRSRSPDDPSYQSSPHSQVKTAEGLWLFHWTQTNERLTIETCRAFC